MSMIDDVPEWFTVENFRDEVLNFLCTQSTEMINVLRPQLLYAHFSYKQLVQRLYDGQPMSTGIDFYMSAARHFLALPIVITKPQFNTQRKKIGGPQYVFEKEYFYEQDSYLGDKMIPLKFIFNGIDYYAPYLQADAACIHRIGAPVLRGVMSAYNNIADLIDSIPPRASLNTGLRKLFLYLKAADSIAKSTKLAAGYSEAAEIKMIKIPGVDPISEGTVRWRKRKASGEEVGSSTSKSVSATVTVEADTTQTTSQPTQESTVQPTQDSTVPLSQSSTDTTDQQSQGDSVQASEQGETATTSSGARPKDPTKLRPSEDFDATYLKDNQCVCGYKADDGHGLRVHTKNQHFRGYYQCWGLLKSKTSGEQHRCPYETDDQGSMWWHYRTKHLGIYYRKCSVEGCNHGKNGAPFGSDNPDTVQKHITKCHGGSAKLVCPHCGYLAHAKYILECHILACTTKDKKVKFHHCEECGKGFRDWDTFTRHKTRVHSKVQDDSAGWYHCGECEKKFASSSTRAHHNREKHTPVGAKSG